MRLLQKLGALVLTCAMVLSFAACSASDTSWILKDGENQLPAGVYLYNMMQSYYMGNYMVEDPAKDILSQKIEDKDAAQWIQESAMDTTKRDLAVIKKFEEMGLSLSEDEKTYAKTQVEASWAQSKEICEKNGIAKSSMLLLNELAIMDAKIFDAMYGPEGEKAVEAEEISKYYHDNYIKVGVIAMPLPSKPTPAADATEEEKKTAEDQYNTELQSVKLQSSNWYIQAQAAAGAGKDFNDIINLRNKEISENPDSYDMTTDNFHLVDTTGTTLPADVMKALKEAEIGEPVQIETEEQLIVGVRKGIADSPLDLFSVQQTILHGLKDKEFAEMMKTLQEADTVEVNEASVEKYTAKKVKIQ